MLLRLTDCLMLSAAPTLAQEHQHPAPDPHAGHGTHWLAAPQARLDNLRL